MNLIGRMKEIDNKPVIGTKGGNRMNTAFDKYI